jgi:protein involved in temperature-dependent protein secretion
MKYGKPYNYNSDENFLRKTWKRISGRTFGDTEGFVRWIAALAAAEGQHNNGDVNVEVIRGETAGNVSMVGGKVQAGTYADTRGSDGRSSVSDATTGIKLGGCSRIKVSIIGQSVSFA